MDPSDRMPRGGEAVIAGTLAAALTLLLVVVGLVLLVLIGTVLLIDYADGPGSSASVPDAMTLPTITAVCGAGYALVLSLMLRALHLARPVSVTLSTTVGLAVAVVLWWKVGPGAEDPRFGLTSAMLILPASAFALCAGTTALSPRPAKLVASPHI